MRNGQIDSTVLISDSTERIPSVWLVTVKALKRETTMVTAILIVFAVLFAAGAVFMVVQALRGCALATVWVCCGGLTGAAELVGLILAAVVSGIADATKG